MGDQMTKAKLLQEIRSARAEWEQLTSEIPQERMTKSGATGYWSVKDVMTHLTSYARWYMNAAEAQLRGEMPPVDGTEQMPFEEKNLVYYEREKDKSLEQALSESQNVHERLLAALEQIPEPFLIEPQVFPDVPEPTAIWQMLRGDVYAHTRNHIGWIRDWLDGSED